MNHDYIPKIRTIFEKAKYFTKKNNIPILKEATAKLVTKYEGRIRIIDFM